MEPDNVPEASPQYPCCSFSLHFTPSIATDLPREILNFSAQNGGQKVPFSHYQKYSLMGPSWLDTWRISRSSIRKGWISVTRRNANGSGLKTTQEEVGILGGTIELREIPVASDVAARSKWQEITFYIIQNCQPYYICLGADFISRHFDVKDVTKQERIGRNGNRRVEYTLRAKEKSFCA